MSDPKDVEATLVALKDAAPAGYALAFHIEFTTPTFLFQSYPSAWIKSYSEQGMVMSDPTVHWGFENEGTTRWSDLTSLDHAGVLTQAATHGLNFGLTCAVSEGSTRSFASFAHTAREFTDAEAESLLETVTSLHRKTDEIRKQSPDATEKLQKLSVEFTGSQG